MEWERGIVTTLPLLKNQWLWLQYLQGRPCWNLSGKLWELNLNLVPSRILQFFWPHLDWGQLYIAVYWAESPYCLHWVSFSSTHGDPSGKTKLDSLQLAPKKNLIQGQLGRFYSFFLQAIKPLCPKVSRKLHKPFQVPFWLSAIFLRWVCSLCKGCSSSDLVNSSVHLHLSFSPHCKSSKSSGVNLWSFKALEKIMKKFRAVVQGDYREWESMNAKHKNSSIFL